MPVLFRGGDIGDFELEPYNIKKDVTIYGVTGIYEFDNFMATFRITAAAPSITLVIPAETDEFVIHWGDGTIDSYNGENEVPTHTYTKFKDYVVSIKGTYSALVLEVNAELISILQWGNIGLTSSGILL